MSLELFFRTQIGVTKEKEMNNLSKSLKLKDFYVKHMETFYGFKFYIKLLFRNVKIHFENLKNFDHFNCIDPSQAGVKKCTQEKVL